MQYKNQIPQKYCKLKYLAFTLAEVLITLGIIGVVAAITIPVLIRNINDAETVTAVKKVYSTFSQAFKLAEIDNGTVDSWGCTDNSCYFNKIIPYLSVAKNCGFATGQKCCGPAYYKISGGTQWSGDNDGGYPKALLNNGSAFISEFRNASCGASFTSNANNLALNNVCGVIFVDINGPKPPNTCGRDFFSFWVTKYGLIPRGTQDDDIENPLATQCSNKSGVGYGCAAWIIYKENMDYMKGAVSW